MPSDPTKTVLVLQGGGALGSYQAGVYQGMVEKNYTPKWLAGISIGAINAAIIAGNPRGDCLEKLNSFWDRVSSSIVVPPVLPGPQARTLYNDTSAALAAMFGLPGFFQPRIPPGAFFPPGTSQALSIYDTSPLRDTLEDLIDFDRINNGDTRLSVGAVNVKSGNFRYFDSDETPIGPEHIMASAALPPGFPPVTIDGEQYWDGGIVSNTPLQYVLETHPRRDMCVFQVDLFSASGPSPETMLDVIEREKDIRFSSRTRLNTDDFRRIQDLRRAANRLLGKLPPELLSDSDVELLKTNACTAEITILHLIFRQKNHHSQSKGYEFSRHSIMEHWKTGYTDAMASMSDGRWINRERNPEGVQVLDLLD